MSHQKTYWVYILTNKSNRVLYIGVTGDLYRRTTEHRLMKVNGFTQKYKVNKLIYYEEFSQINEAIEREKQLKKWNRMKKEKLITLNNPDWNEIEIF